MCPICGDTNLACPTYGQCEIFVSDSCQCEMSLHIISYNFLGIFSLMFRYGKATFTSLVSSICLSKLRNIANGYE